MRQKKQYEIDFIVSIWHEKVYIQSAYKLSTSEKKEQEVRGLRKIADSFRKLVIVDGVQPLYTDEFGISYVGLIDFMLNKDILARSI